MTKLTTERLEKKIKNCIEIEDCQVMLPLDAAQELLAFREAAKNPVAFVDERSAASGGICWAKSGKRELPHGTELYVAPVLPKQPEHSRQHFETLCNQFWNWAEFDEINQNEEPRLEWNGSNYTHRVTAALWKMYQAAHAQPVIPRELRSFVTDADIAALHRFAECCDDPESGGHDLEKEQVQRLEKVGALQRSGRISYITDFGDYLISATAPVNEQQNEPQNIPENIPAQPVSEPYKLISVKDDTPTESGDYWCYLGKDFESPTKYRVVHFDVRHHEFQDHRVTHWMRLPAEPAQEV